MDTSVVWLFFSCFVLQVKGLQFTPNVTFAFESCCCETSTCIWNWPYLECQKMSIREIPKFDTFWEHFVKGLKKKSSLLANPGASTVYKFTWSIQVKEHSHWKRCVIRENRTFEKDLEWKTWRHTRAWKSRKLSQLPFSCLWVRGRVHRGQVANPSQGLDMETAISTAWIRLYRVKLIFSSLAR